MKKTLSLIMTLVVILSVFPLPVRAANPHQYLENVGYFGDPGKCRLTAEQARTYADKINELQTKESGIYRSASLVDLTNEGDPVLIVDPENGGGVYTEGGEFIDFVIYSYKNGKLLRFDSPNGYGWGICIYRSEMMLRFSYGHTASGGWSTYVVKEGNIMPRGEGVDAAQYKYYSYEGAPSAEYGFYRDYYGDDLVWIDEKNGTFLSDAQMAKVEKVEYVDFDYRATTLRTMEQALRAYADALMPTYSLSSKAGSQPQHAAIKQALAGKLDGDISSIYAFADDFYFVIISSGGTVVGCAVLKEGHADGALVFYVLQYDKQSIQQDQFDSYINEVMAKANVDIDYSKISTTTPNNSAVPIIPLVAGGGALALVAGGIVFFLKRKRGLLKSKETVATTEEQNILGAVNKNQYSEAAKQKPLTVCTCAACGQEYEAQVKFCEKCGNKMVE